MEANCELVDPDCSCVHANGRRVIDRDVRDDRDDRGDRDDRDVRDDCDDRDVRDVRDGRCSKEFGRANGVPKEFDRANCVSKEFERATCEFVGIAPLAKHGKEGIMADVQVGCDSRSMSLACDGACATCGSVHGCKC